MTEGPVEAFIDALRSHAPAPSTRTRTVRICVAGRREFEYLAMGGAPTETPVVLEPAEEVAVIMNERKAVEA